jgi:electron transport complex, rnfABCDGE type, A subunit
VIYIIIGGKMKQILLILLISILVDNFCMSKFLGICPFLGVSRKVETAIGMGMAVTFVMVLASIITWLVQLLLVALNIKFAQTIAFILVIAALVQFVEMVIQKSSPTLYQSLGVYLPLITTNCAVLGVAILNIQNEYNLIETIFNGLGGALGFTLAIVLFAGIRERLELSDIPKSFEGFPIALVSASLMAIAFLGFSGLGK